MTTKNTTQAASVKGGRTKPAVKLVWVDIARSKTPGNAIVYGFISPELVPLISQLVNATGHSVVIGGLRAEDCENISRNVTEWVELE